MGQGVIMALKCPLCNKSYRTVLWLRRHLLYHHKMLQECSIAEAEKYVVDAVCNFIREV